MKRRFQQYQEDRNAEGVFSASAAAANSVSKCSQYASTILRFRKWLVENGHSRHVDKGVNIEEGNPHDIFRSLRMPIPMKITQNYVDVMLKKDDGSLCSFSKANAFWSAYIHASGDKIDMYDTVFYNCHYHFKTLITITFHISQDHEV
jgi:hypothetical protein